MNKQNLVDIACKNSVDFLTTCYPYDEWTDEDVESVKDELNENCENYYQFISDVFVDDDVELEKLKDMALDSIYDIVLYDDVM